MEIISNINFITSPVIEIDGVFKSTKTFNGDFEYFLETHKDKGEIYVYKTDPVRAFIIEKETVTRDVVNNSDDLEESEIRASLTINGKTHTMTCKTAKNVPLFKRCWILFYDLIKSAGV